MSDIEKKTNGQKPRTSKLAMASLMLALLWIPLTLTSFWVSERWPETEQVFFILLFVTLLVVIISLILGIVALLKIRQKAGLLTGKGLAVSGITISTIYIITLFVMPAMGRIGPEAYNKIKCCANLHVISAGMSFYA